MASPLFTSGKKLLSARGRDQLLPPLAGDKLQEVGESWLENKQLDTRLREHQELLQEPKVARRDQVSRGLWLSTSRMVNLACHTGKFWHYMGAETDIGRCLYPEEALYLIDTGELEVEHDGVVLSMQQAEALLLRDSHHLERYLVYAHLSRTGCKVIYHQAHLIFTKYETQIRLDKHQRNTKRKKIQLNNQDDVNHTEGVESNTKFEQDNTLKELYESLGGAANNPLLEQRNESDTLPKISELPIHVPESTEDKKTGISVYEEERRTLLKKIPNTFGQNVINIDVESTELLPKGCKPVKETYKITMLGLWYYSIYEDGRPDDNAAKEHAKQQFPPRNKDRPGPEARNWRDFPDRWDGGDFWEGEVWNNRWKRNRAEHNQADHGWRPQYYRAGNCKRGAYFQHDWREPHNQQSTAQNYKFHDEHQNWRCENERRKQNFQQSTALNSEFHDKHQNWKREDEGRKHNFQQSTALNSEFHDKHQNWNLEDEQRKHFQESIAMNSEYHEEQQNWRGEDEQRKQHFQQNTAQDSEFHKEHQNWSRDQNELNDFEVWPDWKRKRHRKFRQQGRDCYPCCLMKVGRDVQSWKEYKKHVKEMSNAKMLTQGISKALWKGPTTPLLRPNSATSIKTVLKTCSLDSEVKDLDIYKSKVPQNSCLEVHYDVYLPAVPYKKSSPSVPSKRVIVMRDGGMPGPGELLELTTRFHDNVPVVCALVVGGEVRLYTLGPLSLPAPHTL